MRTLIAVIIILFTTTVLMLGLIETLNTFRQSLKTDDLKDVSLNIKNYLNKKVDVIGNLYKPTVLFDNRENGIRYAISKEDKEGFYTVFLNSYEGEYEPEGTYRVKGIINYVDVCLCDYRCVDYIGSCVYINDYLYSPNLNIRNFKTNLTSNHIESYWSPNYEYYSKTIDYLCPVNRKDYFECSYEMKKEFDAFNFEWQKFNGIFYKEYRCRPDSLERVYYIEAIEPMVIL